MSNSTPRCAESFSPITKRQPPGCCSRGKRRPRALSPWCCCSIKCRATSFAGRPAPMRAMRRHAPRQTGRSSAGSTRWSRLPGGCSSICHSITAKISRTNGARWHFPKPCREIPIAAVLCVVTGAPTSRSSSASGAFRTATKSLGGDRPPPRSLFWPSETRRPDHPAIRSFCDRLAVGLRCGCSLAEHALRHPPRDFVLPHDDEIGAVALKVLNLLVGMGARNDLDLRVRRSPLRDDLPGLKPIWNGDQQATRLSQIRRSDHLRRGGVAVN